MRHILHCYQKLHVDYSQVAEYKKIVAAAVKNPEDAEITLHEIVFLDMKAPDAKLVNSH